MPVVKISFQKEIILEQGDGYIILKPRWYAEFAELCYIAVAKKADSLSQFLDPKTICEKTKKLFIGRNGGISFWHIRRG